MNRKHKLFSNKTIQLGFKGEQSMQNYIDRALESFHTFSQEQARGCCFVPL
jgi:hypothetical protein